MTPEQAAYEIPEIWDKDWFGTIDGQRVKLFAEKIPEEVKSLLDVGCGNGLFLHHVESIRDVACLRLCGVDRSQTALKHVHTEKYLSSIDCLPFNDNEFDIVTSLEVIEHLPSIIYYDALKEICRVARKYVLIGVPFNEDIRNSLIECPYCGCRFNVDYHLRSFSESVIRYLFDSHGFQCKEIFYVQQNKIMRPFFNNIYTLVRALRTIYKNPDEQRYPGYAVCPACFYENRKNLELRFKQIDGKRKRIRRSILRLFGSIIYQPSYQWIGALYENNRGPHG
jgi:ubiquinone/menaquinone biosynthesis C-methylase UbiE